MTPKPPRSELSIVRSVSPNDFAPYDHFVYSFFPHFFSSLSLTHCCGHPISGAHRKPNFARAFQRLLNLLDRSSVSFVLSVQSTSLRMTILSAVFFLISFLV